MNNTTNELIATCKALKKASQCLINLSPTKKNDALVAMAELLNKSKQEIININKSEVNAAKKENKSDAFIDRMTLTADRFDAMLAGIHKIAALEDPVGRILASWVVPTELKISRVAVPLGVIGIIYESRPNVTVDAACLCFKAGNAILLRGGSESEKTNRAIVKVLKNALISVNITSDVIQYVPFQDRAALKTILKMNEYIDVIIPRGGKSLISNIVKESRIPMLLHLDGICHTYVHSSANLEMSIKIICNAKMRRPGICGATETLLIDKSVANEYLPAIISALIETGCKVRGDALTQHVDVRVAPATEEDWRTEYLDAIISVKVVDDINKAISHINLYGSHHTDAIITDDYDSAMQFTQKVDSAIVMHNCSTQFADGGEFGMGAEIGIATGKLHARGPVGLEQLTTYKYVVQGSGQVRGSKN